MSAAEEAKQRGNELFKNAKYREAVQVYTEALAHEPTSDVLLLNRSAAYMALNEYAKALADSERVVQLQAPEPSAKALLRLSKCQLGRGEPEQAMRTLTPLLAHTAGTDAEQKQAHDVDLQAREMQRHLTTIDAYCREKNWTLASIALDQAQSIMKLTDATSPRAWQVKRVMLLLQRGQLGQAQTLAMDIYRADPSDTGAIMLGARILLANNDVQKALQQSQMALRLDPDMQQAKQFLRKCKALSSLKDEANAAFKTNRTDQALAKYAELLQVADQNVEVDGEAKKFKSVIHSNRAILLSKIGRYSEAIGDCTRALQLDASFTKPLKTRARAYQLNEQYEEAVRDFKRAVDASAGTAEQDTLRREARRAEVDLKRSKKLEYVFSRDTGSMGAPTASQVGIHGSHALCCNHARYLHMFLVAITNCWVCQRLQRKQRSKRPSARSRSNTIPTKAVTKKSLNSAMKHTVSCQTSRSVGATTPAWMIWTTWTWVAASAAWVAWVA